MKKNNVMKSVVVAIAVTATTAFTQINAEAESIAQDKRVEVFPKSETSNYEVSAKLPSSTEDEPNHSIFSYIKLAETSKSCEDVYLADLLIEKLAPEQQISFKEELAKVIPKDHINSSEAIERAEKEVSLAEQNPENEIQLKKAQESVVSLYMSKERTAFVERLNSIYKAMIEDLSKQ